jgi:NADH:ubiquinone oxidoreductase subunit C
VSPLFSDNLTPYANLHVSNPQKNLPGIIYSTTFRNDGYLFRTSLSSVRALSFFLRGSTHLQFRSLIDIAVVDRLRARARFSVNYLFFSVATNQRAVMQVFANETSTIPSLCVPFANGQRVFASANWLEREA